MHQMQEELVHILSTQEPNLFSSAVMTPADESHQFQDHHEVRREEVVAMAKNLLLSSLGELNLPELNFAQMTLNGVYDDLSDELLQEQQAVQQQLEAEANATMETVDAWIDDFVALKGTQMKHQIGVMFRERASLERDDVVPDLLLAQTLHRIESSMGQGCD